MKPAETRVLTTVLATALGLSQIVLAEGRAGEEPPPPPARQAVYPDVTNTPTVTGSPASFQAVSEIREIAARIDDQLPCRGCFFGPELGTALDEVDRTVTLLVAHDCDPELVAGSASQAVLGLGATIDGAPSRLKRREARILRDLDELRYRIAHMARGLTLSTLSFVTRANAAAFRDTAPRALAIAAEGDRLFEEEDLDGASTLYAEALKLIAFECELDVEKLQQGLAFEGTNVSAGWAYAIGRFGGLVASGAGGSARLAQNAPAKAMTPTTKVNTASTAKMITTVAALRLLTDKGIGLDAQIGPYLPAPWDTNPWFDEITFRKLLTHTSGIGGGNQKMADGWLQLKEVAAGIVSPPPPLDAFTQYENVNMGLFRALIPEILGFQTESQVLMDPGLFAGLKYAQYVDSTILIPAGVTTALCDDPEVPPTLYYPSFLTPDSGWLPEGDGNLLYFCGGGGWYLSAEDWIRILGAVRYGGILSGAEKAELYNTPLGWWPRSRSYGTVYLHNGALVHPYGGTRNCIGDFPRGWQVVFHANTNITNIDNTGVGVYDMCNAVMAAFDAAWSPVPAQ